MPGVHFGPDSMHLPRPARGLRRRHLAELCRRHATRADRPGRGDSIYTEFLDRVRPRAAPHLHRGRRPEGFDAAVADAERDGAPVVMQGVMPGGMRFAYVSAAEAGVPYVEIAYIPAEIHAFFDYMKQEQK